jgi:serine/threonine-protein kinase
MAGDSFDKLLRAVARAPAVSIAELDLSGRRLGRFRVRRRLGSGGMGVVYQAWDERLSRVVALKVLRAVHMRSDGHRARLCEEARRAAAMSHPSIATVFDVDEHEGITFMALELVAGEPLRALIDRRALSVDRTLDVLQRVAGGLACAHRAGIVHRDLKPDNVMVSETGGVKLLDFGLASLVGASRPSASMGPSDGAPGVERIGTPGYMAPEQGGGAADARADVFSFGVVAREMLASAPPSEARSALGRALRALADRCMAPSPGARPRDGAELVTRLEALSRAAGGAPRGVGAPAVLAALAAATVALVAVAMHGDRGLGPSESRSAGTTSAQRAEEALAPGERKQVSDARASARGPRAAAGEEVASGPEAAGDPRRLEPEGAAAAVAIAPGDVVGEVDEGLAEDTPGQGNGSARSGAPSSRLPVTLHVDRWGKVVATVDLGKLRSGPRGLVMPGLGAGPAVAGAVAAPSAEAEAEVYVENEGGAVLRLAIRLGPTGSGPVALEIPGTGEPEPGRPAGGGMDGGVGTNPMATLGIGASVAVAALDAVGAEMWSVLLCSGALPDRLSVRLDDLGRFVVAGAGSGEAEAFAVIDADGGVAELGAGVSACAGIGEQGLAAEL